MGILRNKKNCIRCYANWGNGHCSLGFKTVLSDNPEELVARFIPAEICNKPTTSKEYLSSLEKKNNAKALLESH